MAKRHARRQSLHDIVEQVAVNRHHLPLLVRRKFLFKIAFARQVGKDTDDERQLPLFDSPTGLNVIGNLRLRRTIPLQPVLNTFSHV